MSKVTWQVRVRIETGTEYGTENLIAFTDKSIQDIPQLLEAKFPKGYYISSITEAERTFIL